MRRTQATTHHTAYAARAALQPTAQLFQGQRFLRSSPRVWTSGGISAGIDLWLRVVEELVGRDLRDAVVEDGVGLVVQRRASLTPRPCIADASAVHC